MLRITELAAFLIPALLVSGCSFRYTIADRDRESWTNAKSGVSHALQRVEVRRIKEDSDKVEDLKVLAELRANVIDQALATEESLRLKDAVHLQTSLLNYEHGVAKLVDVALADSQNYKFTSDDRVQLAKLQGEFVKTNVELITERIDNKIESKERTTSQGVAAATRGLGKYLEEYWKKLRERAEVAAREANSAQGPDREAKRAIAASRKKKAEDYRKQVLKWLVLAQTATTKALADETVSVMIVDSAELDAALKQTLKDDWKPEYSVGLTAAGMVLSLKVPVSRSFDRFTRAALASLKTELAPLVATFSRTAPA